MGPQGPTRFSVQAPNLHADWRNTNGKCGGVGRGRCNTRKRLVSSCDPCPGGISAEGVGGTDGVSRVCLHERWLRRQVRTTFGMAVGSVVRSPAVFLVLDVGWQPVRETLRTPQKTVFEEYVTMRRDAMTLWAMCTRRIPQVLLAMLAWSSTATIAGAAETSHVEIQLNNTATPDADYFCWTPVRARLRIVGGSEPLSVVLSSRSSSTGGEVVFQEDRGVRPTSADFARKPTITVTLDGSGNWTQIWVAGNKASTDYKDTEVVVSEAESGAEIGTVPLMVRVRKDASALSIDEMIRFLDALRSLHDLDNDRIASHYVKYADAHLKAFESGIHNSDEAPFPPLFLAWHRAFLLSIERELQAIDPAVSIPYWRFDRDDVAQGTGQQIFSVNFMGTVQGGDRAPGGTVVQFLPPNPLFGWRARDGSDLTRQFDGMRALVPRDQLQGILHARDSSGDLVNKTYKAISGALEFGYHNRAHGRIGGNLGGGASPDDPLFFLLHANVDRAWAVWQQADPEVRFDPENMDAYAVHGNYPGMMHDGEEPFRKGSYANDAMWPWSGTSGDQENEDPHDDWPDMKFDMLDGPGVGGRGSRPTPASMIDYLDTRGTGAGTGACYDHLTF